MHLNPSLRAEPCLKGLLEHLEREDNMVMMNMIGVINVNVSESCIVTTMSLSKIVASGIRTALNRNPAVAKESLAVQS